MEKGFTLWITGPPRSGKTALANEVEGILLERGLKADVLDDEEIARTLSKGLGFSKEDRDEHVRRIGFVCELLARNGVAAIAAAASPYREARAENRKRIGRYVEVYCKCPLETLRERDATALYRKAPAGEIESVAGAPPTYEPPEYPEVIVETDKETVEESAALVIRTLEILGYVPAAEGAEYSREEEAKIRKRLEALGYI